MYIPIVLTIFCLFQLILFSLFASIILRNAMSTSWFVIKVHSSRNVSCNADPYLVLYNLILFLLYATLVKTSVGSPHFPCNILCESKKIEKFLHYTLTYARARAYTGAKVWKKKIVCVFSFYVFVAYFNIWPCAHMGLYAFLQPFKCCWCQAVCLLLLCQTSVISMYLQFQ
jgi:hypothetical protein